MDHISKALEKATSERQSVRDWVQPASRSETILTDGNLVGKAVSVNTEWLQQHHILSGPGNEDPTVADKYRLLRTRTIQLMKPRDWTILGITSAGPQAGKSLTAMNLAITMARSPEQRVVLVDADLRKPTIATDMGLDIEYGLIDYLTSDISLSDVLVRPTEIPNLTILPGRRSDQQKVTPELLSSPKMRDVVEAFANHDASTLVVVDLPPVLIGDDVIVQASHLQCMLLVVEEGGTNADELKECAELLMELNLLGTVLNKSTEKTRQFEGYYQMGSDTQTN